MICGETRSQFANASMDTLHIYVVKDSGHLLKPVSLFSALFGKDGGRLSAIKFFFVNPDPRMNWLMANFYSFLLVE